ncbi:MAG TPA: YciI family protein [Gemmatimonadales bacterium]|nr:YciI family protein [Gemmatimonadales bacterium]
MTTPSQLAGPQPFMPRPEDLETVYVAFLYPGASYGEAKPNSEEHRVLLQTHAAHVWNSQHGDGPAVAGGPLLSESAEGLPKGMSILRAESLAEAQHLAAIDPAVVTGHFRVVVVPWLVAPGRLPKERPRGK